MGIQLQQNILLYLNVQQKVLVEEDKKKFTVHQVKLNRNKMGVDKKI